jgi:hypothetical protein
MKPIDALCLCLGLVAATLMTGCGRDSAGSSPAPAATNATSQSDAGNPATAAPDYLGALGQAKTFSEKQVDLAYVRQGIQMFQVSEGRYPRDLQELVPNYIGKIPPAPAGCKISYNPANGEVKVEKQ